MQIISWNVNGIRAVHKKGLFLPIIEEYKPDIVALQETKAEQHFSQVVAKNGNNSSAMYYLGLIAENTGKHMEALNLVAALDNLDKITAGELKVAMGIAEN